MEKLELKFMTSNKNSNRSSVSFFLFFFFALVVFSVPIILWNNVKTKDISQINISTTSLANYYSNDIELQYNKIEFALNQVNKSGKPSLANKDWDSESSFYIENFSSISSILWADTNFKISSIATNSENKFVLNENINDYIPSMDHLFIWLPTYQTNQVLGFLVADIDITKLVLNVTDAIADDIMIKILINSKEVYTSENWASVDNSFAQTKQFDIKNTNNNEITLKPSEETLNASLRYTNQILYYGFILSIAVIAVILLSLRNYNKSSLLLISQKEIQEKNRIMLEQLRHQQKLESIGLLATGVAHEINNPINGVLNYTQIIMDSSETNDDNVKYASEIMIETKRMLKLVQNILLFSSQQKDQTSIARIEDIIDRTYNLVMTIFMKDQIDFKVDVEENLPNIKCRSQQIQQVLMNLLINARDALNDKYEGYNSEKIIVLSAKLISENDKTFIRIIVEDHGNGIPLSVQPKIFDNFFTTKDIGKGTGLGLTISNTIINEHGGTLIFETEEGEYTRFIFVLPCHYDLDNDVDL